MAIFLCSTYTFAQNTPYVPSAVVFVTRAKMDLAEQLVKTYDIKGQWLSLADQVFEKKSNATTPDELATFKKIQNELKSYDIENDMKIIYMQTFTIQELELLNNFYKTPEGQRILKKNQQLSEKLKYIQIEQIQIAMKKFDATTWYRCVFTFDKIIYPSDGEWFRQSSVRLKSQ